MVIGIHKYFSPSLLHLLRVNYVWQNSLPECFTLIRRPQTVTRGHLMYSFSQIVTHYKFSPMFLSLQQVQLWHFFQHLANAEIGTNFARSECGANFPLSFCVKDTGDGVVRVFVQVLLVLTVVPVLVASPAALEVLVNMFSTNICSCQFSALSALFSIFSLSFLAGLAEPVWTQRALSPVALQVCCRSQLGKPRFAPTTKLSIDKRLLDHLEPQKHISL